VCTAPGYTRYVRPRKKERKKEREKKIIGRESYKLELNETGKREMKGV
jgi:hypothetical protein